MSDRRNETPIIRSIGSWRLALTGASLPLLLFFALPLLALVIRTTPGDFFGALAEPEVGEAIRLSVVTTALATGLTAVFGTPLAFALARPPRRSGRRLFTLWLALDTLLDLPIVLPPAVAGIALLVAFGRRGLLGAGLANAGIELAFTPVAVVLAQLFVAAPFYLKTAAQAFRGVDREMEQAAALDGASAPRVFRAITLPLSAGTLLGGLVMTWARALGEFGATILFAGNLPGRTQTMPLAIYLGFEVDLRVALTLSVLLLAVSFVVLALVRGALRLRVEAT